MRTPLRNRQDSLQNACFSEGCPSCESSDLDSSVENIDAICNACGFVTHDFSDIKPESIPDYQDDPGTEIESNLCWGDFCTVSNSTEDRIASGISVLETISDEFYIPTDVRLRAAELYGKAAVQSITDGRPTQMVVACFVYLAARESPAAIPVSRLAESLDDDSSKLNRLIRTVQVELDIEHTGCPPENYLSSICMTLGLPEKTRYEANQLIRRADEAGLTNGRNPVGVAGSAIYCVSAGGPSQREVAIAAGVSKETIRVRVREFRDGGLLDE